LPRALTIFRQERQGSFSDSYLHQLSLSFKLVKRLGERFQVSFDGFFNVGERLFARVSLTDGSGKLNALRGKTALGFFPQGNGEFSSCDFKQEPTTK